MTRHLTLQTVRGAGTVTCTVTGPSPASPTQVEDRLVHARDLAYFKSDMTTLIQDMIQSSPSSFASQFESDSLSKGDSSQDPAQRISRDQGPSPDHVYHVSPK